MALLISSKVGAESKNRKVFEKFKDLLLSLGQPLNTGYRWCAWKWKLNLLHVLCNLACTD